MNFPGTCYVKIINPGMDPWITPTLLVKDTAEKTAAWLTRTAKQKGIPATYEAATIEEFLEYKKQRQAIIDGANNEQA